MAVVEEPTTWFEDIAYAIGKFQPILLECVRRELSSLAAGQGRKSRTARLALDLAAGFMSEPCGMASVDDEILSSAASGGALVATVDIGLHRSASDSHVRVVSLRKGRVAVD